MMLGTSPTASLCSLERVVRRLDLGGEDDELEPEQDPQTAEMLWATKAMLASAPVMPAPSRHVGLRMARPSGR